MMMEKEWLELTRNLNKVQFYKLISLCLSFSVSLAVVLSLSLSLSLSLCSPCRALQHPLIVDSMNYECNEEQKCCSLISTLSHFSHNSVFFLSLLFSVLLSSLDLTSLSLSLPLSRLHNNNYTATMTFYHPLITNPNNNKNARYQNRKSPA